MHVPFRELLCHACPFWKLVGLVIAVNTPQKPSHGITIPYGLGWGLGAYHPMQEIGGLG